MGVTREALVAGQQRLGLGGHLPDVGDLELLGPGSLQRRRAGRFERPSERAGIAFTPFAPARVTKSRFSMAEWVTERRRSAKGIAAMK